MMNEYDITIEKTYTIRAESEERALQRMRELLDFAGCDREVKIVRSRFVCKEEDR